MAGSYDTKVGELPFGNGQPNNAGTGENCGMLENGKFSDYNCATLAHYICEAPGTYLLAKLLLQIDRDQIY